jgi:NADP-dependent 3-hydroxy acid dehydrogenase YdfG
VYSASKHAVHGFSETLRLDYGNTGIKISEVLPGMVKTEFAATRFDDENRGAKYYEDFGICLEPEDIARSVMFVLDQPTDVVIAQVLVLPTSRKIKST